ncbi:hypothetical protein ACOXXX_06520 [Thalassococcus sp. BH17M4-6]|uniref:hypothetical protein n=1 Tax=Thalassococcus sp. BH17M4-6 TaxID=3413148 RepID=UPI003BD356AC
MDWVPECLLDNAGAIILKGEVCIAGLEPLDILGLIGVPSILAIIVWLYLRARRAADAVAEMLPANDNWPEISNLTSQHAPDNLVARREMQTLSGQIARAKGSVVQATVKGMAGVGKTTLALEVARREQARFRGVWVIRAANPDTIRASLQQLALRLSVPGAEGTDREGTARAALDTVAQDDAPWLLIYDNADDPEVARGIRRSRPSG